MSSPDPRLTLARPDLADVRLQGTVRAARYAPAVPMRCAAPVAAVRRTADEASERQDELVFGEAFDVLETVDSWAWGQARRDGYVGFVRIEALAAAGPAPSHRVRALRAHGFSRPDLKSPPVAAYAMNALVAAGEAENGFLDAGEAGFIYAPHLARLDRFEADPAAVALRFLEVPYLWGGRTAEGLDCSGLIQQALYACGRACPRDASQQAAAFSQIAGDDLRRGDLVFWKGHVGMMLDAALLIHANAHHMAVAVEPLAEAVSRIEAAGAGSPTGFRRP